MSKYKLWITMTAVAVVVLAAVGIFSTNTNAAGAVETVDVVLLEQTETVDTTGTLEAQPFAVLNWKTSGVVETIRVQPGDQVEAGDTLLTLRADTTSSALVSAQADLESARKNLNALTAPDETAIGQARENVSSAFEAWDNSREKLMDQIAYNKFEGDDHLYEDVVSARDDLSTALEEYPLAANSTAQFYYWTSRAAALGYQGEFDFAAQKNSLRKKLSAEDSALVDEILRAQIEFEKQATAFAESIEDQEDAIEVMQALGVYQQSSDALLDALESAYSVLVEPSKSDMIAAQAKVDAAQASVNNLKIIAPFAGQVLSVEDRVGDVVTTGALSVNLADMSRLYVEAQVDESDVANIRAGNPVRVTLDALPGVELSGSVELINPVGEVVSGLVKYSMRVALDEVDDALFIPLGSTANVSITVRDSAAVLAAPITAIQNDEQGEYVLVLREDGSSERIDIISGSIVGDLVVVNGELRAGDQLLLVARESGFSPPNPFGGKSE